MSDPLSLKDPKPGDTVYVNYSDLPPNCPAIVRSVNWVRGVSEGRELVRTVSVRIRRSLLTPQQQSRWQCDPKEPYFIPIILMDGEWSPTGGKIIT